LDRYKARGLIIEELRQLGLIERVEDYTTDIAHSDRSKTPIEPMLSDQWFVRMSEIAQPALDAVKNGRIKFHPERYGKTFIDWLEEKRDWCISRQLWWGHRIPVWWVEGCNEEDINKAISEKKNIAYKKQDGRFFLCSANTDITQDFIKGAKIEQDPDVLDTWFSSALWPLATFGWPENTEDLKTYYPTDVLVTAREIITLWVARMVVCGLYNTKQIPFKDVVVHAVIQDGQGRPMKKSLGNGVDPEDIIAIYGCDALRFTLTHIATETQDVRLPVQRIRLSDGTEINSSKQFEIGRNFANKLWNVSRFVLMQAENIKPSDTLSEIKTLPLSDRWIISRMHNTIKDASYSIDRYHFNEYAGIMYNFVWSQFCDWYVEIAKSNTSNPYTLRILIHILDNILRLLHPSMPFITEEIWQEIKRYLPNERHNSIVVASWPEYYQGLIDANVESEMNALIQIITAIRNIRSSAQIPKDKTIEVIINIKPEKGKKLIEQNLNVILHLCKAEKIFIEKDVSVLGAEVRIIGDIEVYVPLMGIVDIEKQRQRLQKQHETTEKEIQDIQQRLKNPFFLQNADKQVISETKERLDILEQEREILQRNIKQLR
jgi:valyl-tRNA synthetase